MTYSASLLDQKTIPSEWQITCIYVSVVINYRIKGTLIRSGLICNFWTSAAIKTRINTDVLLVSMWLLLTSLLACDLVWLLS